MASCEVSRLRTRVTPTLVPIERRLAYRFEITVLNIGSAGQPRRYLAATVFSHLAFVADC
jgi:hypothetical protein